MIKILTREYLATYTFLAAEIERMKKESNTMKIIHSRGHMALLKDRWINFRLQNVILLYQALQ